MDTREKLVNLMRQVRRKELRIDEFCREYESTWNFELQPGEAGDREAELLKAVFDVVVLFSPYEEERERYPGYKSEAAVLGAVDQALQELG